MNPSPPPPPGHRPARRPRIMFAGVAVLAMLGTSIVAAMPASAVPAPSGWTTAFGDDFDGAANTGLNTGNWLYDLGHGYPGGAGNWGTGEVESNTNSTQNVFLDGNGHLVIRPIRDGGGNWTSGRIETQRTDFAAPAGGKLRIEASLQQPNVSGAAALGYWPAFWALGAAARPVGATNWPSIGELDVMEDINGRSSVFGALHCGVNPGGPCNETTGITSGEHSCGGCQSGFHTYALEYDRSVSPEQLRWYLDGNNYFTVNANQVDATTWNNATQHGFFIILNVAIGGGFPGAFGGGPTGSTQSGVPMTVDYVAVYTAGGGGGGGGGGGANQLTAGQRLLRDQRLTSPNGRFNLVMQSDGNLVLYDGAPGQNAFWSTGTWSQPADRRPTFAELQSDGNLVLYNDARQAAWAADVSGSFVNPFLELQNDGNLVIYHNGRTPIWASNTAR
jgi:beta-glucanase (GH16 family)